MTLIVAFAVGLLFGIGLIVAGMTNPAKVLGFLDLAGPWDPSLAFVMGGAVAVGLVAFAIAGRRQRTLLGGALYLPTQTNIDRRLVLGSQAFGIGWGLAGLCPGPALALLSTGRHEVVVFVAAMLGGMGVFEGFELLTRRRSGGAGLSAPDR